MSENRHAGVCPHGTSMLQLCTKCQPPSSFAEAPGSAASPEIRKWAFEKAMLCKTDMDIVTDIIYKAAEIEAYITEGKNPRSEFQSCVDTALAEVDHADIAHVGNDKKRKVMEVVRKWLKEYDAL